MKMQGKNTVVRADIANAIYREIGLSKTESAELVNSVFQIIEDKLSSDENVKLANFGQFQTRQKTEREARNPKTGEAVTIAPRRVVTFKPSKAFINRVDTALSKKSRRRYEPSG